MVGCGRACACVKLSKSTVMRSETFYGRKLHTGARPPQPTIGMHLFWFWIVLRQSGIPHRVRGWPEVDLVELFPLGVVSKQPGRATKYHALGVTSLISRVWKCSTHDARARFEKPLYLISVLFPRTRARAPNHENVTHCRGLTWRLTW